MKRIMLLLLAVLLIPMYSRAISLDELTAEIAETPERFYIESDSAGIYLTDKLSVKFYMTNNNSTLIASGNLYYIYTSDPGYIYKCKMKGVKKGSPNSTLVDLLDNGVLVSWEALSIYVYTLDGTLLPEKSQKMFARWQKENKMWEQQVRKHSAFI